MPPGEVVGERQLVRYRERMVRERTRFKNLIHGILLQEGIKIKAHPFSSAFIDGLHRLDNWRIEKHLVTIEFLDRDIQDCDARVARAVAGNHQARLLTTVPGIGNVTALALASEIGDISRFPDMDRLASYFGLVPSVRNSASTTHHGSITKAGTSLVRHLLTEATISHVSFSKKNERPTPISAFYARLAAKRGGSKAKVAAAAKLLRIVFWMLQKDIGFWKCVEEGRESTRRDGKKSRGVKK